MKLTFNEALERINEERSINPRDVRVDALNRVVWLAEWHLPGCLSESQSFCATKRDAIDSALWYAESENGFPRGMKTALRKGGYFESESPMFGRCVNTISKHRLAELL